MLYLYCEPDEVPAILAMRRGATVAVEGALWTRVTSVLWLCKPDGRAQHYVSSTMLTLHGGIGGPAFFDTRSISGPLLPQRR